jgi:hypothetical protein
MGKIGTYLEQVVEAFRSIRPRRRNNTIDSLATLEQFSSTRAAFISQKTMYGYVKARMGTKFVEMFRDPLIIQSVNIAKMHHFAACLSDLCIFVSARALADPRFDDAARRALAERMFAFGMDENKDAGTAEFDSEQAKREFHQRVLFINWSGSLGVRDVFTHSPQSIMRWAPIADHLKALDKEYVENSVKFAWIEIGRQFEKHFVADETRADVLAANLAGAAVK